MEKRNINSKVIVFVVIIVLCIFIGIISVVKNRPLINIDEDILRIYYFNVGQADSTLIINKGETMLSDGGN